MTRDRAGLELSTSQQAARFYVDGVDRMLAAWSGAGEALQAAVGADPGFALGHAALARFHQMAGRIPLARESASRAGDLAQAASRRERQHVACIATAVQGNAPAALQQVEQHMAEFPADALVLSLALGAFGLYAFSGSADHDRQRLALCERLAPTQPGDDWWFLTYLGWGHTEAGNLEQGQRITARAFELRRENAHGAHALAHSFHECGQHDAGVAHLDAWLPDYDPAAPLYCHVNWHRALLDLQAGEVEAALARFHQHMHPGVSASPPINVMTDGASLMWRIMLYATPAPSLPWQALAEFGEHSWPRPAVPFIDVHCAMAAAAGGDGDAAQARARAQQALDAEGKLPQGPVPPSLALAARAFLEQDYDTAVALIEGVLPQLPRLGGSHAQREVHEETLIAACLRSGRKERAAALLRERLSRRPSALDARWLELAG